MPLFLIVTLTLILTFFQKNVTDDSTPNRKDRSLVTMNYYY